MRVVYAGVCYEWGQIQNVSLLICVCVFVFDL